MTKETLGDKVSLAHRAPREIRVSLVLWVPKGKKAKRVTPARPAHKARRAKKVFPENRGRKALRAFRVCKVQQVRRVPPVRMGHPGSRPISVRLRQVTLVRKQSFTPRLSR